MSLEELNGDVFVGVHTLDGTYPPGGTHIYAKDLTTNTIYEDVAGSEYYTTFSIRKDTTTEIWAKLNYSGRLTDKVQLVGDKPGGLPNFDYVVNLYELPPAPGLEWWVIVAVGGGAALILVVGVAAYNERRKEEELMMLMAR